ncbi:hypothetical protein ACWEWI_37730 [Streptomyces sp. NPDC003753]|uniref:hypothetical protein n=1 Tax=Streptomyces sp. Y2F8-2 TaxID=2759675 RepID=UPI001902CA42|nr:hypothetical protein [Streptomyces sp. Y2F8-2]GHK05874.1 hypothetical protein SY2F82_76710 [Streptomyces sp. Y2F8-2]
MQETGSRPTWPVILIDDDQWLTVCESDRDIQLAVEPDFVDDIVTAYDGLARSLELLDVGNQVTLQVSGPPQPEQLHRQVQEYFDFWTREAAPAFQEDVRQYIASVAALARSAAARSKKGRPTR